MRRQSSKFTKDHTTQHTRRRMRPSGGRPSEGEDQKSYSWRQKWATGWPSSTPPTRFRGSSKSQIQQACSMYPPKSSIFTKFTKDAPPASMSEPSLAIHTPPSSDNLIRQLCHSRPVMIVGLCVTWSPQTDICISMGSSNFLRAVLDISRKATAVKEIADCNDRLHYCIQNTRLYSYKLYCRCVLAAHGRSHATVALVGRLTIYYGIRLQCKLCFAILLLQCTVGHF